jgi:hypothetical protein
MPSTRSASGESSLRGQVVVIEGEKAQSRRPLCRIVENTGISDEEVRRQHAIGTTSSVQRFQSYTAD